MVEVWKPVAGFELRYEVSDRGGLRNIDTRLLLKSSNNQGYPRYTLTCAGQKRYARAHILVLEAFDGPRPTGFHGCHKDGDRQNNWLGNLYWGSRADNEDDKRRHGTGRGMKHSRAILTDDDVREIRRLCAQPHVKTHIARRFNVSRWMIRLIAIRKNWAHVEDHHSRIGETK
jgi:hypothetical protein